MSKIEITDDQLERACEAYDAEPYDAEPDTSCSWGRMLAALQSYADSLPRFELTAEERAASERLNDEARSPEERDIELVLRALDRAQGMPLAGHLADYVETLESANRDLAGAEARAEAAERALADKDMTYAQRWRHEAELIEAQQRAEAAEAKCKELEAKWCIEGDYTEGDPLDQALQRLQEVVLAKKTRIRELEAQPREWTIEEARRLFRRIEELHADSTNVCHEDDVLDALRECFPRKPQPTAAQDRLTSEERQHLELVRGLLKSPEPLGNVSASALLATIDRLAPPASPAPVPAKRSFWRVRFQTGVVRMEQFLEAADPRSAEELCKQRNERNGEPFEVFSVEPIENPNDWGFYPRPAPVPAKSAVEALADEIDEDLRTGQEVSLAHYARVLRAALAADRGEVVR